MRHVEKLDAIDDVCVPIGSDGNLLSFGLRVKQASSEACLLVLFKDLRELFIDASSP